MKNRKMMSFVVGVFASLMALVVMNNSASAISAEVTEKAFREIVRQCYVAGEFDSPIDASGEIDASDIVRVSDYYYLPNGNATGQTRMTCREALFGNNSGWSGVIRAYAGFDVDFSDPTKIRPLLEDYLQYSGDEDATDERFAQKCFTVTMTAMWDIDTASIKTGQMSSRPSCVNVDENSNITSNMFSYGGDYSDSGQGIYVNEKIKNNVSLDFKLGANANGVVNDAVVLVHFKVGDNWEQDFLPKVRAAIESSPYKVGDMLCTDRVYNNVSNSYVCNAGFVFNEGEGVNGEMSISAGEAPARYSLEGNLATLGNNALKAMFNGNVRTILKVSDAIELYQSYLNDAVSKGYVTVSCGLTEQEANGAGLKKFSMIKDGAKAECFARINDNRAEYNGLTSSMAPDVTSGPVGIETILDNLTTIVGRSNLSADKMSQISSVQAGTVTDYGDISEMCFNAGLEGGSWIACPALDNVTNSVDGLESVLNDMLAVDDSLYNNQSPARVVWETCRNIANVIIIVVLLVVIFSQLTGYGIDNYGIKKILPRLILIAILLNLSFYICQLAIDLSNILGVGLSKIFKDAGNQIYGGLSAGEVTLGIVSSLLAIVAGAGASAGVVVPFVTTIVTQVFAPMIILSLVLSVVVAFLAVVFFFITVAARQVIVILCVALAPIAFVAYILPNTQSIFKRWWSIFKAALIVYPICGALYGLSFVLRGIIFSGSSDGVPFWMGIIAIFAPFLPFFLLPTLLKGALSSVGAIGGAIASIGGGLRRGVGAANQTLRLSEAYKSDAEAQRMAMDRRRAVMDGNKFADLRNNPSRLSRWGRFWRGGERGITQARQRVLRDTELTGTADNLMGMGANASLAEVNRRNLEKQYDSYVKDYESFSDDELFAEIGQQGAGGPSWYADGTVGRTQKMRALISSLDSRGKQDRIFSLLEEANVGNDADVMNELKRVNSKVLNAYGKAGVGKSFREFMSGVGADGQQRMSGVAAYVSEKGSDFIERGKFTDKDAAIIRKYDNADNHILDDKTLVAAEATYSAPEMVRELDAMYAGRSGLYITPTPSQFANFNESTVSVMSGSESGRAAISLAYSGLLRNADLMAKMDPQALEKARIVYEGTQGGGNGGSQGGPTPTPTPGQGGPTPGPQPVPPRPGDFGGGGVDLRGQPDYDAQMDYWNNGE